MTMRENVVAGKTPVGTKVEAKLTIATLFEGTVIPMDATFSGEVTESREKSDTEPSHLADPHGFGSLENGIETCKALLDRMVSPSPIANGREPFE